MNFSEAVPFWLVVVTCLGFGAIFGLAVLYVKNHPKAKRGKNSDIV